LRVLFMWPRGGRLGRGDEQGMKYTKQDHIKERKTNGQTPPLVSPVVLIKEIGNTKDGRMGRRDVTLLGGGGKKSPKGSLCRTTIRGA